MTKTVVQEERPAEAAEAYRKVLEEARNGQGEAPGWLQERRDNALERFQAYGVPHPKLEAWRQTNLGRLRKEAWPIADAPGSIAPQELEAFQVEGAAACAVLVDGHPVPESSRTDLPGGARLLRISDALTQAPDLVEAHLAKVVEHDGPEEALRALNTAAFRDGWMLHVPKGVTFDGPIQFLHVATGRSGSFSAHPRILVVVDETAEVTVVESYEALAPGPYHVNAVAEFVLGQSAVADHVKLQREGLEASHTAAFGARLGRDSKLRDLSVALGAGLSRYDLTTRLGEGAEAHLNGLFLGKGEQVVDHHTWIDHAEPHGTSIELYKGILDGKAHGIFTGNILVRPDAQKTNSDQENRNLILSDKALIDTTPQLEIHADDVKCAHGSTIGQLPEEQIYYLQTRGFSDEAARRMLTQAFAAETLDLLAEGPLRHKVEALVAAWFTNRKETEA